MKQVKTNLIYAILLGLFGGIIYQTILFNIPFIRYLDVKFIDVIQNLKSESLPPENIVLVKIRERDLRSWGVLKEPDFYSQMIQNIIDDGAKVIVLNLLPDWVKYADEKNNPLKNLIINNQNKIVLATRVPSLSPDKLSELHKYNQIFPFDSQTNILINPSQIQGFFSYDAIAHNFLTLNHPARTMYLQSEFILADDVRKKESFKSVALLTLKKYKLSTQQANIFEIKDSIKNQKIYINYRYKNFNYLSIDDLEQSFTQDFFRDKIIIVGFSDLDNPNSLPMYSPNGEIISGLKLQALQITNLLDNSYYYILPSSIQSILIITISVIISIFSLHIDTLSSKKKTISLLIYFIFVPFTLIVVSLWLKIILDYIIVFLTWILTYIFCRICLKYILHEELLQKQECELIRLKTMEQEAIINQAKKLIKRLAVEIHDGPLQEIKIILDELEWLEKENHQPQLSKRFNLLLNQVEKMGKNLRCILGKKTNNLLEISPELKNGLTKGLEITLKNLEKNDQLFLPINLDIERINEPNFTSLWLSDREDIYIFFCEAISNIIKHAQPPYGNATYVEIILKQKDDFIFLEIINDGIELTKNERVNGGYGCKLMEIVAMDLPEGNYHKKIEKNLYYVCLSWKMLY
ncbi:CHASE2 domain-containing protein [Geminocystis sp. CENA526]|uniref:sensor histidine kinase n=1 Tax=Geminocystis sp. CENA526 TaxID=1355871 RepID=UPI003D6FBA81